MDTEPQNLDFDPYIDQDIDQGSPDQPGQTIPIPQTHRISPSASPSPTIPFDQPWWDQPEDYPPPTPISFLEPHRPRVTSEDMSPSGMGYSSMSPVFSRAEGGPVSPGEKYLVGEKGPEVFKPDRPGLIIPGRDGVERILSVYDFCETAYNRGSVSFPVWKAIAGLLNFLFTAVVNKNVREH